METRVEGLESVKESMAALSKRYSKGLAEALIKGGQLVRGEAIKSIQSKSQGKTVTKSRDGKQYEHTQAAAGDAPNTDTGALVKSIQIEVKPEGVYVGSDLEYARYLEMNNHEFLQPALKNKKKAIIELAKETIKGAK